ncbi:sigma 54-interacting transcriptional regulator [Clostridium felsineum]|uniref:Transcriptional regulatory protein DagR n=1 Tax=Clostridium felsineum TaxID=36839 RepID=A0A1S8M967_9CLOT|nr:sigma-54-dependent transcriptional regulator [Clostridium felsineum]MCR3760888.1 sigma 54-interacting transcriptional regulator [Clostridium felsineum]URZ07363.1 Transcriptional regulatory protein DagR [Clostridium felsineum]URZ12394.1 Transcriptional regulatory protein DagR [Clostridium felsineum]
MKDNRENIVFAFLKENCERQKREGKALGCTTEYISKALNMQRTYVSSLLNSMYKNDKVIKLKHKPVIYIVKSDDNVIKKQKGNLLLNFKGLIGSDKSLKKCVQQAKAAMLYPPSGLHTLLLGGTGVGKTMFAECMYKFAVEDGILNYDAPFISFNCADFANNTQLLMSQLFGYKKGAFTGANEDKSGIVKEANFGILFLDEVHRLPPEGQEMLFYIIDKGEFKPLGEVKKSEKVNLLIICATTESVEDFLLPTLLRRIPMIITLPYLKERTLTERFELIGEFFKVESTRINKEISVTPEIIKSLLLYNCVGNIGQLKNDIQLGCANAFLRCVSKGSKKIQVDISDFNQYVKRGILNYKKHKENVDNLINENIRYVYTPRGVEKLVEKGQYGVTSSFYEEIEKRIAELKKRGISEKDIQMLMSIDVDNYFKRYIYKIDSTINREELSKVVDKGVISLVENFLDYATKELNRLFSQKVFYGLSMHLSSSFERIRHGKRIINYKLKEIIENHPDEYAVSMRFATMLEKEKGIKLPLDEVGFLAMFILSDIISQDKKENNPVVLIAMHGVSTASSMADVVNKLVGENNTYAYDMPLNKSTDTAYYELKELILDIDQGSGILLLVDMGSLGMFGEMISEETGIKIKVIDMATTVIGLECSRKAVLESNIDVIFDEVVDKIGFSIYYERKSFNTNEMNMNNVIITMCMTGEGSAIKLRKMIEDNINFENKNIEVFPMAILNKEDMNFKINKIAEEKNILCIVGTVNPEIYGIPYISVSELFRDNKYNKIQLLVNSVTANNKKVDVSDEVVISMLDNLKEDITAYDFNRYESLILIFIKNIERRLNITLEGDKKIGLAFHIACGIEKLKMGEELKENKNSDKLIEKYKDEIKIISEEMVLIEEDFKVKFSLGQAIYIIILINGFTL